MTSMRAPAAVRSDLVAVVRDLTQHELWSCTEALDAAEPGVIAHVWQRLVELNIDRALLTDDLGGVGLDVEDFFCVLEEVAVGDAGVALAVLLNNAAVVSLPAALAASLPSGDRWTVALTPVVEQPIGAGLELTGDDESVHVTGRLRAVLGAVDAGGVVVAARLPQPTVVIVRAGLPGLTVQPDPLQMGLRAARSADLVFSDAALSIAVDPGSAAIESRARSLVHCGVAAISRGIARRAYGIALAYAHTRIQGGKRIVEHGAVSDMLADMTVRLRAHTVDQLGTALDDPAAALAHKIAASDASMATAIDAVQVMGGVGYMVDTGAEKLMRDAKYCQLYPERNWLARHELIHSLRQPPEQAYA